MSILTFRWNWSLILVEVLYRRKFSIRFIELMSLIIYNRIKKVVVVVVRFWKRIVLLRNMKIFYWNWNLLNMKFLKNITFWFKLLLKILKILCRNWKLNTCINKIPFRFTWNEETKKFNPIQILYWKEK